MPMQLDDLSTADQPSGLLHQHPMPFQDGRVGSLVEYASAYPSDLAELDYIQRSWTAGHPLMSGDSAGPSASSSNCYTTEYTPSDADIMSQLFSGTDVTDLDVLLMESHDEGGKGKGFAS